MKTGRSILPDGKTGTDKLTSAERATVWRTMERDAPELAMFVSALGKRFGRGLVINAPATYAKGANDGEV
jgi:hypothetical protein